MNVLKYNREAWDRKVAEGDVWTRPCTPEEISAARQGRCEVVLTPQKHVPQEWLGPLVDRDVLALACGGGQQGPLLAAAGARVTVFDNSPAQLGQDQKVAQREGLDIAVVEGDMADLSAFADDSFDLIFHPVSNIFVPQVRPVWQECARVLRSGGELLAGFANPLVVLKDQGLAEDGVVQLKYSLPYAEPDVLDEADKERFAGEPLCFGHSLEDQIAGQLDAGFVITGFYEDQSSPGDALNKYLKPFLATRAKLKDKGGAH